MCGGVSVVFRVWYVVICGAARVVCWFLVLWWYVVGCGGVVGWVGMYGGVCLGVCWCDCGV